MKLESIGLSLFLGLCAVFDVKTDRIPNKLTLSGLILGLSLSVWLYGFCVLPSRLLWTVLPVLTLIILFKYRVIGAGDIKLLCVCGAFSGKGVVVLAAGMFLLTALYGVVKLVFHALSGIFLSSRVHMSVPALLSQIIICIVRIAGGAF